MLMVSTLKGAGAYFALAIADQLIQTAYINKGGWLICYAGAFIVAFAGLWCIIESFIEFTEVLKEAMSDESE